MYQLECPHCQRPAPYTFTLRTGAGVLLCPHCGRCFQVETKSDAVVRIRPQ